MDRVILQRLLYIILSKRNSGIISYFRGYLIVFVFLTISVTASILVLMEYSNTEISGHSEVTGNAVVSEGALVSGNVIISEEAVVSGNAEITGDKTIYNGEYNGSWNLFLQVLVSIFFLILAVLVFGILSYYGSALQKFKPQKNYKS